MKEENEIKKTSFKENLIKLIKKDKHRFYLSIIVIILLGILLIFSTYAWFSTALNVRVKTFNMIVTKNSGLSISFDAINYDRAIEISEDVLINKLVETYPNNLSQWAANGLVPVSSPGITNNNSYFFDIYSSSGVRYKTKDMTDGFISTALARENSRRAFNNFIAFDLFLKNETGSPIDDNLYLEHDTEFVMTSKESTEEMIGLVNSARIGFVKVGSVPINTPVSTIQNLGCNNNCQSIIYEPNSLEHSDLSIERAKKFGINLKKGNSFPTYAYIKAGGPFEIADTVSGSVALDYNYFKLQKTITEDDFDRPLFSIPNGITKLRVYVWLEGQDIDSLETDSEGAEVSISISFVKDTQGYTEYE